MLILLSLERDVDVKGAKASKHWHRFQFVHTELDLREKTGRVFQTRGARAHFNELLQALYRGHCSSMLT